MLPEHNLKGVRKSGKKNDGTRVQMEVSFALFTGILLLAWSESFFRFLSSMMSDGEVKSDTFCIISGCVLFALFLFLIRNKVAIYKMHMKWMDAAVILYGTLVFLTAFPFPDNSFDTIAYGLHLQEHSFIDVAHTNVQFYDKAYSFNLAERVFYWVRHMFGYRFAVTANWFCFLVTYCKVKEILLLYKGKLEKEELYETFILPVACGAVILTEYFVFNMQVMKPDLFIIPIVLECLRFIYINKEMQKSGYVYLSVLIGLGISLKPLNVIFFLPVVFWAIVKYVRAAKFSDFVCAACPAIVLVSVYVIYNYYCVKNPIFPYYNHIFKSEYMSYDYTGKDLRWGPKGFAEWMLWPFIIFLHPQRYGEVLYNSGRELAGIIICLFALGYAVFRKNKKYIVVNLSGIIYTLLFNRLFGYCRYGILIDVMLGVCVVFNLLYLFAEIKDKNRKALKCMVTVFFTIFTVQIVYAQLIIASSEHVWAYQKPVSSFAVDRENAVREWWENLKLVFHDKGRVLEENGAEIEKELAEAELWIDTGTGYTNLLNPDADTCFLNYLSTEELDKKMKQELYEKYADTENIYGILNSALGYGYAYDRFEALGFSIDKITEFHADFLNVNETIALCKLRSYDLEIRKGIEEGRIKKSNRVTFDTVRNDELADDVFMQGVKKTEQGAFLEGNKAIIPIYFDKSLVTENILSICLEGDNIPAFQLYIDSQLAGEYEPNTRQLEIMIPDNVIKDKQLLYIKMQQINTEQSADQTICLKEIKIR